MNSPQLDPPVVRMPHLAEGSWLNTAHPLDKSHLRGKVVLIDFWDYTCVNCIRTLPYLVEWHKRYAPHGFEIIGIHTPEFKFAQTVSHIENAIEQFGIRYPILLDNGYENWSRFATKAWPTKFLVDPRGYIRFKRQGEGHYQQTERAIQTLLKQANPDLHLPDLLPPMREEDTPGSVCYRPTPELYAGYSSGGLFGGGLGNPSGYVPDQAIFYQMPPVEEQEEGHFYLEGAWRAWPEAVAFAGQAGGKISVPYSAASINAVLAPSADAVELTLGLKPTDDEPVVVVEQNGRYLPKALAGRDVVFDENGRSFLRIIKPGMVQLVNNHTFSKNQLTLTFEATGLALFTFSFTSCIAALGKNGRDSFTVQ